MATSSSSSGSGTLTEDHRTTLRQTIEQEHALIQFLSLSAVSLPPTPSFPLLHVTKLDLPNCKLSELPECLPNALPNLSILFLSNNVFETMPSVVGRCPNLQMVAFKGNGMRRIDPEALQPQLRWLILTDNKLSELPSTIGRCTKLQKLMLSGNEITRLPSEISKCSALELIRLASNRLEEPPMELLRDLPNLAWVGLSNNPFLPRMDKEPDGALKLPLWDDVPDGQGEVLGTGAAGVVRKVQARDQWVAVKTFASSMTSDGLAQHERHISCLLRNVTTSSSSSSSALVRVLGETKSGSLILEYLDGYTALASPPSLESCSRDVYDKNIFLSEEQANEVVSVLLSTLFELHQLGICHGDFYSHNLLVNANDYTQIRLSDLGAAFQYDRNAPYGTLIQRAELRAFVIFLQELMRQATLSNRDSNDAGAPDDDEEDHPPTHATKDRFPLLWELYQKCQEAADSNKGFEEPLVWWKQKQLRNLAMSLNEDLDLLPI